MGELVPLSEAIKQAAAVLGMDESAVADLAAKAKAEGKLGNKMLSAGAIVAVGNGMQRLMKLAADAEAAGVRASKAGQLTFNGVDLAPYVKRVYLSSHIPHNPANRRTFRLGGKPYHYVQTAGRLETRPGESPWQ